MKLSFFNSSGWVGDAYTDEGGGDGFSIFIHWLWKSFWISLLIGIFEYFILLLIPEVGGVNYTVLQAGHVDFSSFVSKALVCGAFAFSAFFVTAKSKKMIFVLAASFLINYGYALAFVFLPILGKIMIPFTWVVSGIFIALGSGPIYIVEHYFTGINVSVLVMVVSGMLFGLIIGSLYSAIVQKIAPWYAGWE